MRSGRVRRRARPLERTWARVFREAGARVQENMLLRDMAIPGIVASDGRALEVVVGDDAQPDEPVGHSRGEHERHCAPVGGVRLQGSWLSLSRSKPSR